MNNEFVENLEAYIRLNARGEMSPQLTLDYIKLEVREYRRKQKFAKEAD